MNKITSFSKTQKYRQFALAFFACILFALSVNAQYVTVPTTGYTYDIVANGVGATNTASTGTMPGVSNPTVGLDGGGFSFIDGTYKWHPGSALPACSLPSGGAIPSLVSPGLTFQLQDYSSNNSMTIASNTFAGSLYPTTGTINLVTPASYGNIFVLYESVMWTSASAPTVTATVNFTDGTSQIVGGNVVGNWFTTSASKAYNPTISRAKNVAPGAPESCTAPIGPYLFQMTLPLFASNHSKLVQSISFGWSAPIGSTSNTIEYLHVMALGGMLPCTPPSAQPTLISLNAASTAQINGTFSASPGNPTGYLVVRYPTGATETQPVNSAFYSAGVSLGAGTVVQVSNATTFNSTGLTGGTTYDYYVYAYNNTNCAGGPNYLTTSGFFGTQTTNSCSSLSGTIPVGPSAPASPAGFQNLTQALNYVTAFGLGGHTILELQSDYTVVGEALPFTFSSNACVSATKTLTIHPASNVTTPIIYTSASTAATFLFDGGSYITIDGRPGGTGTDKMIQIINTTSTAGSAGKAILMQNEARNNTFTYLDLKASNLNPPNTTNTLLAPGAIPGVIAIASTTGTTGNDNNTISFCDIHSATSTGNILNVGVYAYSSTSLGSVANNDNNTINGNNIYDCFNATTITAGINISLGNNNYIITNNSYYKSDAISYTYTTAGITHRGFWIAPGASAGASSGYTISGNCIGGTAPNCGGNAYTMPGSLTIVWFGMDITVGTQSATNVLNNTIRNINLTSTNSLNPYFAAMNIATGLINIGSGVGTGNTIGSGTGNGSITINNVTSSALCTAYGIRIANTSTVNVNYNTIGSITINNGTSSNAFVGIGTVGSGTISATINNNLIGSLTTVNSIQTTGAGSASIAMGMCGIYISAGVGSSTINNNTIKNMYCSYTGASFGTAFGMRGIDVAVGSTTISGNTISNLVSASIVSGSGRESAICAISMRSVTAPANVSGNTIHTLKLTNPATTAGMQIVGILMNGAGGANIVNGNNIHSFTLSAINTNVTMSGIACSTGVATYSNNMIRLGFDELGNSITTPIQFRGITKGSADANLFYHNSIYIGGTNVGTATTPFNTYAFQRGNSTSADAIVNNIFVNNRSNASTGGKHYSINMFTLSGMTINYNDYYGTGNGYKFAGIGSTDYDVFVNAWVPGDGNSYGLDPQFINPEGDASNVDLHIDDSTPSIVEGTGTPLASVTNDFDNETRALLTPTDIGADAGNFISMVCNGTPLSGTAAMTQPGVICITGTKILTLTNFSNLPGFTYQWQESATPGGPYVNVTGGTGTTSTIFTTPTITSSTYYVCEVTCSIGGSSSLSSEILVEVNTPEVIQTVPGVRCGAGSVTLEATSSAGTTLKWYSGATGGTAIGTLSPFSTPFISANTNYYVAAAAATPAGCESARTLVTATLTPSIPIAPASVRPVVCSGSSTQISVSSANDPNYTYTWTSNPAGFTNTGSGPFTVTPAAAGTTYQVYGYDSTSQCGAVSTITVSTSTNNLTVTPTATPATVCQGRNSQLNVNVKATPMVKNYTFSSSTGTFTPLSGATSTSLVATAEDVMSTAFNIGFPFIFNDTLYNTVQACSNGALLFGSGKINNSANGLGVNTFTFRPGLAPLWDDLQCREGVKYLVSGTAPNRVLTVEWLNMEWSTSANAAVISFQVKLYEGTNVVDFIYRQEAGAVVNGALGASIGIMGSPASDFISLQNTSSAPTLSTTISTNNILTKPATDQVYTFTPPPAPVFTYSWTGSNLSSTSITNPVAQNITGSSPYSVLVTDITTGCTKNASISVNMHPVPSVSFTTDLSNFYCENQNINFDATGTGFGTGGQSYNWSGPGFVAFGANPTLFGSQVTNSGNFTVTYTDGNGCTATETQYVEVNPNPVVNVTTTPASCLNMNDGTATFDITVQPTYNDYAILEGSNSGSSNPQTFTDYFDGTYFYQVSELNTGCTSFGSFTIETVPNIAPVIVCPSDIMTTNSIGMCGAYVNYTAPVGTDNCSNGLTTTLEAGPASGGWFPIGTTVVRYRVTDELGAYAECTFNVVVEDTEAPSYVGASTCPANFTACNPVMWNAPLFQDNCPGLQVTSSHQPGVNFPIGVTPVTYTATDLKGNVTTCSFNVTILDSSLAANNITSDRDFNNICSGGDVTLTVNGGHLGESSPGVSAQWKWYAGACGTGPVVGTGSSITVTPTATTTYYVRAEGGCRITTCVQLTVVVSAAPPSSAPVFTSLPVQGAPGVTDVLAVAPVTGATYYRWFTNNGHISSVLFNGNTGPWETNVPTVNVSFVLPQQNYQLRVIAGNACGRTSQTNTTIRGTVPAPTSMTGPTQACPGSPVTYSITAIPNGSPVTYNWALVPASAGTITMAANGLSATVNFATGFGSAQVCVNGISSFGLAGPSYCTTVTSSAPVPGAIAGNPAPCSGNVIPEIYSINPVPSAVSYNWSCTVIGATVVQAGNGLSASITFPAGIFTGSVQVTASSTCGTSAPSVLNVTNGVPGNPGAISGATGGLCGAQDVAFSVSTSNALSYLWSVTPGMSINGVNNLNAVTIDFLSGFSSGTVTVEAFYACGSVIKTHPVSGTPSAPLVAPAALCANSNQTYFVSNLEPSTDYTWTTSGDILDQYCSVGSTSNCTGYYIETGAGGGSFIVTATNTCGTASTTSDPCRVMAEAIDMKLFPNPTSGLVTIELYSKMGGNYQVTITDLSGRQVLSQEFKASSGRNSQEIDLGFANAGMYMVYIKDAQGNIGVQKLSVE